MSGQKNPDNVFAGALLQDIRKIIAESRAKAYASVSAVMINTYWQIGRRIVEEEQHGDRRADYGTHLLKDFSASLVRDFGTGFNYRNIFYCRQFYLFFPDLEKLHTRVQFLTWSHFRALLRVADEKARQW